ncbi:hypothetical protein [Leifsonia sp. Leaf264]|uniref:hypothetical protein n=1 Tax=Leifsonia sp. Leaf264 TaxID=1736314 RepID=UPI0006FEAE95|nr:hypothetical protein [Leifsonia sp. Leaf264]KQO98420.1 hypothetical protein ASF30_10185 [Leifsonia sp. Leaf264]
MKTTTKKIVLACTLITTISLGSVGAAFAASSPEPVLSITTAAQASVVDGNAVANSNLSAASRAALEKAVANLDAAVKAGKADPEIAAARADLLSKLAAAKTSAAVYLTAINNLTQTYATYNPQTLPAWLTADLAKAQAALNKAVDAGASDADVKALTVKVEAWLALVKDWRPANAAASSTIQQTATLVNENTAPYATSAALAAVVKAQTLLKESSAATGSTTSNLNAAIAAARTAIDAAKKSSADRAASVIAANGATKEAAALYAKYKSTVIPAAVAALQGANTTLTGVLKTATPAQLAAYTKLLKDKAAIVAKAGAQIDASKKLAADAGAAVKKHPKATAAQKAAVTKAVAALNAAVKAKAAPEKLVSLQKAVAAAVAKLK